MKKLKLKNPFILAPLAGITDTSMRKICIEQGASLVYTEMVSAKGLYYKGKKTEDLLRINGEESPVAFQMFGSEPEMIAFATKELESRNNAVIDLNLGCPVPKVVKNGEGSALLKTPEKAAELIKIMVDNSSKPVTAKMRIGWDADHINAVEVAKRIEDAGAAAIAVHGRTREQYYSGKADWAEIKKVKDTIGIPVIGSGDITCGEDAVRMLNETGCDMVMIARGALGNPWIFKEAIDVLEGRSVTKVSYEEKINMLKKHFMLIAEDKGEQRAVLEIRKFAGWYLKGMKGAASFRGRVNTINTKQDFFDELNKVLIH